MAKYNLIMKDSTYVILVEESIKRKISMGRLLNDIIDAHVAQPLGEAETKGFWEKQKDAAKT